ncbi:MAG: hypothetical protein OJF60_002121 [Burkholderiaceae bacterium]|jgi:signal transduction histidine kinase|nr:MAG: hypothetical protein OJF60_002121 [Burkholderiaceae bacterium]
MASGVPALIGWFGRRTRLDRAMLFAVAALGFNLLFVWRFDDQPGNALSAFSVTASYQWSIAAVAYLLLQSAAIERGWLHWIWIAQAMAGTVMLGAICLEGTGLYSGFFHLWQVANVVLCLVLAAGICWGSGRLAGRYRWFLALMTAATLGIAVNDVVHADTLFSGTASGQYLYPELVMVIWIVMTGRALGAERMVGRAEHVQALARLRAEQAVRSEQLRRYAIDSERKRIASDLHDGVGSQLVNLIAKLDPGSPQQRALAVALEQCLLDLKIMVDAIEGEHDSIIDALARLRYRVQPALDRLGIEMSWNMQDSSALAGLPRDRVLQLLRIGQEALSNVLRHSGASLVEVTCRYVESHRCLLLEICDDGRGIQASLADRHEPGRGLRGMRERARAIGASLEFSACRGDGGGTRLLLLMPLPESAQIAGSPGAGSRPAVSAATRDGASLSET